MKILQKKTSDLIPYINNARTHTPEQIDQVAASIKEFGFCNPVLIDKDGGIIAGHCRVLAAKKLGFDKIPTITLGHLTDTQRKAYILADNKLALNAGWDDELLALELGELKNADFDLDLTGFDLEELEALICRFDVGEVEMPTMSNDGRKVLQQITFTLHIEQLETLKEALRKAKEAGPFIDTNNENSNGNAIARIAEEYLD